MILVDLNGNTFTSSNTPTEQWQSQLCPYVLWFEPSRLSVNLKYVLPLRILTPINVNSVKIKLDHSRTFTCVPPQILQDTDGNLRQNLEINWGKSWYDYILSEEQKALREQDSEGNIFVTQRDEEGNLLDKNDPNYIWFQVSNQDVFVHANETLVVNDNPLIDFPFYIQELELRKSDTESNFYWCFPMTYENSAEPSHLLWTFYLIACNGHEETVLKNIKIEAFTDKGHIYDSTVVQVGGTFYDESEELKINASNNGIKLPADICKAFWNCGFEEYYDDKQELREKLKELLFNYMGIRGECGNYASAQKSLKWFGWGEKVQLSQLLILNLNVQNLYLNDYFDIFSDMPRTFKYMRTTTFLSLKSHIRIASGLGPEILSPNEGSYTNESFAEEKPVEDLLYYEDSQEWISNPELFGKNEKFLKTACGNLTSYQAEYNYVMGELALKLACLASLYERYFLPVQLNVVSSSVVEHVSSAPLKYLSGSYTHVIESVDNITPSDVIFEISLKKYTVQTLNSKAYIDFTYMLYVLDPDIEYLSYKLYLSIKDKKSELGKLLWYTDLVIEDLSNSYTAETFSVTPVTDDKYENARAYRITSRVYTTELEDTITKVSHLSLLYDGKWTLASIQVTYPDFALLAGTLEYEYNLQDAPDPQNIFSIHEPDIVSTLISEKYSSENSSVDNIDYWEDETISTVSEYVNSTVNIPSTHKNLVITQGATNILDEMYCYSDLDYDSFGTYRYFSEDSGEVFTLIINNDNKNVDLGLFKSVLTIWEDSVELNNTTGDIIEDSYGKQVLKSVLNNNELGSFNETELNKYSESSSIYYQKTVFGSKKQTIDLNYYKLLKSTNLNSFFRISINNLPFLTSDSLSVYPTFINLYITDFRQLEVWISEDKIPTQCLCIINGSSKRDIQDIITVSIKDFASKYLKQNKVVTLDILVNSTLLTSAKFYGIEFLSDDLVLSSGATSKENILSSIDIFTYQEDTPLFTDSDTFDKTYYMFCEEEYEPTNILKKYLKGRKKFNFLVNPQSTPYALTTYAQVSEYQNSNLEILTMQVVFKNKDEILAFYRTEYNNTLTYGVPYIVPAGTEEVEYIFENELSTSNISPNYLSFKFGAITYEPATYAMFPRQISYKDLYLSLNGSSDVSQFFDTYVMINQYQEYFNLLRRIMKALLTFNLDSINILKELSQEITIGYTQRIKKYLDNFIALSEKYINSEEYANGTVTIDNTYDNYNSDILRASWNELFKVWLQEVMQLQRSGNIVLAIPEKNIFTTENIKIIDKLTEFKEAGLTLYPKFLYKHTDVPLVEPEEPKKLEELKKLEIEYILILDDYNSYTEEKAPEYWGNYLVSDYNGNISEGSIKDADTNEYNIVSGTVGSKLNDDISAILDPIRAAIQNNDNLKNDTTLNEEFSKLESYKYESVIIEPMQSTLSEVQKERLDRYALHYKAQLKLIIYQLLKDKYDEQVKLYNTNKDIYYKKYQILHDQENNPGFLVATINSFLNNAPKYYIQLISKLPLNKLFGDKYLSKFSEIGLTTFQEDEVNTWKQNPMKMDYMLFGYKTSGIALKSLVFMVNRFKFKPAKEDLYGFTLNKFFKDDLIVCRVMNTKFSSPFYGYSHDNQSVKVDEYGRYEISRRALSANSQLIDVQKIQCILNYLIFDKEPMRYYLNPGYYNIKLRYAADKYKNYEKKFTNFIFIQSKINSMLYNDKY